jgi:uncharacterized protein (TIGR02147 family)
MRLPQNINNPSDKIFDYANYRLFLRDYYEFQKRTHGLTCRQFAERAGLNSSAWLTHLIKGAKNLSEQSALRVSEALDISPEQRSYFRMLVRFNQARTGDAKDKAYREILDFKKTRNIVQITDRHYEYYTRWYHPVVRSLVSKIDFKDDFALLGRCCVPPISPKEARSSVRLLEKLDLIRQQADGQWTQTDSVISTGDEVDSLNVVNYHKQVAGLAQNAYDRCTRDAREISALTLGIDEATFKTIKARIQSFRKELIELARNSSTPDRVYQMNFQLFPVSRIKGVTKSCQ